jgi:hypothetical protein
MTGSSVAVTARHGDPLQEPDVGGDEDSRDTSP